jgi:hypothetical protein
MSDSPSPLPARPSLEQLRKQAKDLLRLYRAGDSTAADRLRAISARLIAPDRSDDVTLADAQFVLAREHGFENWAALAHHVGVRQRLGDPASALYGMSATPPFYRIDWTANTIEPRAPLSNNDWDTIVDVMRELRITGLVAGELMTDEALARVARLEHVTSIDLGGSNALTDAGLRHLSRMPQLEHLDVSGWKGHLTDHGLEVLRQLPSLTSFKMCWNGVVTDAGVARLASCDRLEDVNVMGTHTGDGLVAALAGKPRLRHLRTGRGVTDAGLALLHDLPIFKTWQCGDISFGLTSADASPNHLMLDGPFTNAGLASLVGLDGLFGLSLFWHSKSFTADGLAPLTALPNLGFLSCGDELCDDTAMRHISTMPRLCMLLAQGTVASDAGWEALSRSQTIEHIWGRDCTGLTGRGFKALSAMPALRGLAVSCKQVDDAALSALPHFPALRELVPMDVSDKGFRHVGQCEQLERLWCMYCRDTTDVATEQLSGLSMLGMYYAGKTLITDRSLDVLGRLSSLEKITLWQTAGVTNAGVAALSRLPRLRELTLDGLPLVTREGLASFPAAVRVNLSS